MSLDVTEIANHSNKYYQHNKQAISLELYQPEVCSSLKYFTHKPNIESGYTGAATFIDKVLQPMQSGFTPKTGKVKIKPYDTKVFPIKADIEFTAEEIEAIVNSVIGDIIKSKKFNKSNYDKMRMDAVAQYIISSIINSVGREYEENLWNGVYKTPTQGNAGNGIDCFNGLGTQIDSLIDTGEVKDKITEVTLGAYTKEQDELSYVSSFIKKLPKALLLRGCNIYCSHEFFANAFDQYRTLYNFETDIRSESYLKFSAYPNVKLCPMLCMDSSSEVKIWTTVDNNLVYATNLAIEKLASMNSFLFVPKPDERKLRVVYDLKFGVGFEGVGCDDQKNQILFISKRNEGVDA
ncbi:hypothetical protein [Flammeovirga pacifica]|uniref:Phage capsid protein n=1 Tax=Flammeovirga pacifica TaxID=915059 RepID=A0A1S1YSE8_FLAPC|nr:hypothetical protein [Flammeovirga pacifica]OHX63793.1 hypothetical protein NH26_24815 [Flammeovirga pacifica]